MTTRRRTSLPAVCRCLPSDKSEASGETRRAGTWRWWRRRGDGRRSHSLCVIWGNLQINTTAWCSEPLSSPTSPHCISPSLPSPPLPPFSQPSWLCLSQASFISLWLHFWGMHGTGENYQWQQSHGRWKIDARNNFKMIMEILQVRSLGSLGGGASLSSLPQEGAMTLHWMEETCSAASPWGIHWQISVSVGEASKCMGAQGWSCYILHIQGSGFFHEPWHFINTRS